MREGDREREIPKNVYDKKCYDNNNIIMYRHFSKIAI